MPKVVPDLVYTNSNLLVSVEETELNCFTNVLIIFRKRTMHNQIFRAINSSTFGIVIHSNVTRLQLLDVLRKHFTHINRIGLCFANPIHNDEDVPLFLDGAQLFLKNEFVPYSKNVDFMIQIIKEFNIGTIDVLSPKTLNYNDYVNYYTLLINETEVCVGAYNNHHWQIQTQPNKSGKREIAMKIDIEDIYFKKNTGYYKYVYKVPRHGNTGKNPTGFAVDNRDNIYVNNSRENSISKITPDGNSVIFSTTGDSPLGIAIDSKGNIYTTNENNDTISKVTPDGISSIFINTGRKPLGIIVDPQDNIYVTNSKSHTVTKVTTDGTSHTIQIMGQSPGGILYNRDGTVFTANNNSHNITRIMPDGTCNIARTNILYPGHMVVDSNNNLYITSINSKSVYRINPNGETNAIKLHYYPIALAVDKSDNIYITVYNNKYIYIIRDKTPYIADIFGSIHGYAGYVYVDRQNNIYVTDITNNWLHKDVIYLEE